MAMAASGAEAGINISKLSQSFHWVGRVWILCNAMTSSNYFPIIRDCSGIRYVIRVGHM